MAFIVTAEDDTDIAEMIELFLHSAGHTVLTATDGVQALALVTAHRPDLVILDHHMPGLTGLQVATRLRADTSYATMPLLMLSAAAPPDADQVLDHVLAKPVGRRQLLTATTALLATPRLVSR